MRGGSVAEFDSPFLTFFGSFCRLTVLVGERENAHSRAFSYGRYWARTSDLLLVRGVRKWTVWDTCGRLGGFGQL